MMRPYAEVIGDPIAHSKSPLIHNFWLGKLGIDAEYRACHVRPEELADYFARRSGDAAWRGCNVTMPHKLAVLDHLGALDTLAQQIGAVNTIVAEQDALVGHNTDVAGILSALPPKLMPTGAEVCILGTGGAARSALAACQQRGISIIMLCARDQAAARKLHREFKFGGSVGAIDDAHNLQTAEVIINATSLGMNGATAMPDSVLAQLGDHLPDAVVFDMVYSPLATELLRVAKAAGCRTVDGLAMLIGQAAVAFEKFFGQPAPRQFDAELRALLTK